MNVFEDLIVELKEENLLEETVIDHSASNGRSKSSSKGGEVRESLVERQFNAADTKFELTSGSAKESFRPIPNSGDIRAMLAERMSSLQLIEYVVSSSGRMCGALFEQFDDLAVKKVFHIYGQACSDTESNEYFDAESALISSIEAWENDLARRDSEIPPWALREYAETANPPLSPQALFAMARFYRTSTFSSDVATKFEFIATRLFSKVADGDRREILCSRSEIARHLREKYREWNVNDAVERQDSDTALLILSLDDLAAEVDGAARLSEVVSNDLFERLTELKSGSGRMIFAPEVAAAAVDTNLRMAAKILSLVNLENERDGLGALKAKYTDVDVTFISDAIGRTVEIIRTDEEDSYEDLSLGVLRERNRVKLGSEAGAKPKPARRSKYKNERRSALFGANRWLLLATFLTVVASVGLYVWSEYYATETVTSIGVKAIDVAKPELKQHLKSAKLSGSMLYAIAAPSFDELKDDEKQAFLKDLLNQGTTQGYDRVSLMNSQGKTIGYASKDRIDIGNK
jgi:hypothetical protein